MTESQHKHLCVHGHFYQPPREDPFTNLVPDEPGAGQYRNFNEKITTESYRPNAEVGNFANISFDMGPTLAIWLARYAPDVYLRMIESDRQHVVRFGIGNAIAHAYNHTILPLANSRDKRTQITWGIIDFKQRFGRMPEGMWLAETAIDMESLELMAEMGIQFTVLAPWQAAEGVDTTEPYWIKLSKGRRIAVFFYNGPLSGDVSFSDAATSNADAFVTGYMPNQVNWTKDQQGVDQIITIATDGELYGHHKPFRDRFLAHLLSYSAPTFGYEVTTLGRYLRDHQPTREMTINSPSAWSCFHQVARWDTGCSCTDGDSSWKPVLRSSLTHLSQQIDSLFEVHTAKTLADPWLARDHYIELRNRWITKDAFWTKYGHRGRKPKESHAMRTLHLLEAEYCMQASYTSCGWFFEDLDRIEPRNDINQARCAMSHVWQSLRLDLQRNFVSELANARSWRTQLSGDMLYQQLPALPSPDLLPSLIIPVRNNNSAAS